MSRSAREGIPVTMGRIRHVRADRRPHTEAMAHPSDLVLRRLALALFAVVVVLDVVYVQCLRRVEGNPGLTYPSTRLETGEVLGIAAAAVTALVLTWLRPRNPVGWLVGATGFSLALCDAGQAYGALALLQEPSLPAGAWVLALTAGFWIPAVVLPPTLLLNRYPTGGLDGAWARRFELLVLAGLAPVLVGYGFGDHAVSDMVRGGTSPLGQSETVGAVLASGGGVLLLTGALGIVVGAVLRLVRTRGDERRALLLLFGAAVTAFVVAFVGPWEWTLSLAWNGVLVAVAVGVLKYGALGIELTVLSGDRADPFATLQRLGSQDPVDEQSLPDVLKRLQDALGVGGVALEGQVAITLGTLPEEPLRVPLTFGGQDLGTLVVGSRPGRPTPSGADRRVAEAVAPLIAAVLHAVRLAEELREEKVRVVSATRSERGRLRQELHDGLGPSLTGIGLGLEALAAQVPDRGGEMVHRLRVEVAASLEETRRIIDDLRPAALDGEDLAAARRRVDRINESGALTAVLESPELPALPPAVSAAALRIAEEALTNVVRHARARHVEVRLVAGEELVLSVGDDGVGAAVPREGGVGLGSMRERAERLGGRFELVSGPGGTVVTVALPLEGP